MPDTVVEAKFSSTIRTIRYNHESEQLTITFKSGGSYAYQKVPEKMFKLLVESRSKGKFFAAWIKDKFPVTKVPEPKK